jgi:plasmid maintenance system antidote protein VapI
MKRFIPPHVGEVIKGALQDRGISEKEFAKRTGLSDDEVHLLLHENGRLSNKVADSLDPVFPRLKPYFLDVQEVRDYYERYGVVRPQGRFARRAVAFLSDLIRR